jgi:hypothetical protein
MSFSNADWAVQELRFSTVEPAEGGEVADLCGGQFRAGGEVEPFQGGLFVEVGAAQPAVRCGLELLDVVVEQRDELGRDRHRSRLLACRCLRPRRSFGRPSSVQREPTRGSVSASVIRPHLYSIFSCSQVRDFGADSAEGESSCMWWVEGSNLCSSRDGFTDRGMQGR